MINKTSSTEFERPLQVALKAARQGGRILVKRQAETREIRAKGFRDIVTDADLAANRAIRTALEKAFPDHIILSEEDPLPSVSIKRAENIWILDPLDGTTNYSRGFPVYAVSLALAQKGQAQVGVIYDPLRDECFSAVRGQGAFLNGRPIHVSQVRRFQDAIFGFELSHEQGLRERGLAWFARLGAQSVTARIGGSAALSLAYIAAGRMDGYMHLSLNSWDVAAGILIAREAGARVTHLDGSAASLNGGAYLAANSKFLSVMLQAVRELQAEEQATASPSQLP